MGSYDYRHYPYHRPAEIDGKDPVELRAYLVGAGRQLTETWLYQWRAA